MNNNLHLITKIMPKNGSVRHYADLIKIKDGEAFYTDGFSLLKYTDNSLMDNCIIDSLLQKKEYVGGGYPSVERVMPKKTNCKGYTPTDIDKIFNLCEALKPSYKKNVMLAINANTGENVSIQFQPNMDKKAVYFDAFQLRKFLKAIPKKTELKEAWLSDEVLVLEFDNYEIYSAPLSKRAEDLY